MAGDIGLQYRWLALDDFWNGEQVTTFSKDKIK